MSRTDYAERSDALLDDAEKLALSEPQAELSPDTANQKPSEKGTVPSEPPVPAAVNQAKSESAQAFQALAQDAVNGDPSARDSLSIALTGKSIEELSDDPDQLAAFEKALVQFASGRIVPNVKVVSQGDINDPTYKSVLPTGVRGAYVPGKDGEPGTILIAEQAAAGDDLDALMLEEMGEAFADHARSLGLDVHEGDVGHRMSLFVLDQPLPTDVDLFSSSASDQVWVKLNGEDELAYAQQAPQGATASPFKGFAFNQQALTFMGQHATTRGTAQNREGFSITKDAFLEFVDFPPGTEPTDAFLEMFTKHDVLPADAPEGSIGMMAIHKMFASGVAYTSPHQPGKVFGDPARAEGSTLAGGILDHKKAVAPDSDTSAATAHDILAGLKAIYGPDAGLPTLDQIQGIIVDYGGGNDRLDYQQLTKIFLNGVLQPQTKVLDGGLDYKVFIITQGAYAAPTGNEIPEAGLVDPDDPNAVVVTDPDIAPPADWSPKPADDTTTRTSADFTIEGALTPRGQALDEDAAKFLVLHGQPSGPRANLADYTMSYADFREALGGADGLSDALLDLYAGPNAAQVPGTAGKRLDLGIIRKMFQDGFVATNQGSPADQPTFALDLSKANRELLSDFIFADTITTGPSRNTVNGDQISASLKKLFPQATIPKGFAFDNIIAGYESVDGQGLDRATLGRVFTENAIFLNVGQNGQLTITVSLNGPMVDNTVEGAPTSATEFVQKWGKAAPATYIGPQSVLVSYETLLGSGDHGDPNMAVNWQGQVPTEAFFELYRNKTSEGLGSGTTPERYLSLADIEQMAEDGVLVFDEAAGMTFGHMENVDPGYLVDGIFRDFASLTGPDAAIDAATFTEALGLQLATSSGQAIVPDLQEVKALFAKVVTARNGSPQQVANPTVTAKELKELFISNAFVLTQTAGDKAHGRMRVDTGPYQGEEATTTTQVFGAEGEGAEGEIQPATLAQNLGISVQDAELLVKLTGHPDEKGSSYSLSQAEFSRLLKPDQAGVGADQTAVDLTPVLVIDDAGKATVNWNSIRGNQIIPHLFVSNGQIAESLEPVELIDRMTELFGAANIDLDTLNLIADRHDHGVTQEMSSAFVQKLFDDDVIVLAPAEGGGVVASINLDGDISGTPEVEDPDSSILGGSDTLDVIFQYDGDGDGAISSVELERFFDARGASPDTGKPATEQAIRILGEVYASGTGTHTTSQKSGPKGATTTRTTADTFEFSREDIRTMLNDGVIRAGHANTRGYDTDGKEGSDKAATRGAVLDLELLPDEKLIAAAFGGQTQLSLDDFLDNLTGITGDINPLKDGGIRDFLKATVGQADDAGNVVITSQEALDLVAKGVISMVPHNDGTHIRTLPNLNALLAVNPEGVFDYLDANGSGAIFDNQSSSTGGPRRRGGTGSTVNKLEMSKLLTDVFDVEDLDSVLPAVQAQFPKGITEAEFLTLVEHAKVPGTIQYDINRGLQLYGKAPHEGPVDFELGEGEPATESADGDGTTSAEEFSPFPGADGELFAEDLTFSTPDSALNVQLENGEGSVSELAIADVFETFRTAGAGSIKRKHYVVMLVGSMLQRGLSYEDIGNQLTNGGLGGDQLFARTFNKDVYEQYENEVANDAAHQKEFIQLYVNAVDKRFSENFGISGGQLVEAQGSPITFTDLLVKAGQWAVDQPDGFFAGLSLGDQTGLMKSFSLMATFLKTNNQPLLEQVATKLQQETALDSVGDSGVFAGDADGTLEVDIDSLSPDQQEAADRVALLLLAERVNQGDKASASTVTGSRRMVQFLNLMLEKGYGLKETLKIITRQAPLSSVELNAFGMTAGEFNSLTSDSNMHSYIKMGAGLLGTVGLAMRYGGMDPAALSSLKEGDPRHVAGFTGQLLYISAYLAQSGPDVATSLKVHFGGQTWAMDDLQKEMGVWSTFLGNRPDYEVESSLFHSLLPGAADTLTPENFSSIETIKSTFGLEGPNPTVTVTGMGSEQAARAIHAWYHAGKGTPTLRHGSLTSSGHAKDFVKAMGNTPGSARAVFISVLGGDPTYFHSFQASQITQHASDGFESIGDLKQFLTNGGMKAGAIDIVVSELIAMNNDINTAHVQEFGSDEASMNQALVERRQGLIDADGADLNARQHILQHLWDNDAPILGGQTKIDQGMIRGTVNTGNFFGAQNNFSNVSDEIFGFVPSMYPTPELPASSLRSGTVPGGIKPKSSSTLTKVFKGLKIAGSFAEWGADIIGAGTSIADVVDGKRRGDDYDVATGSVGIANAVFNIAAIALAGSGGALTLPISLFAGLTGVAQIIMGIAKPPADAGDAFADKFMSDFSDFPELFQTGAHDHLSNWYNKAKDKEQEAEWEKEGTKGNNSF